MKKIALVSILLASLGGTVFAADTATTSTTATIQITLEKKSYLLAQGTINPAPTAADQMAIKWTSPNNLSTGNCYDSVYKIKANTSSFTSKRTPWYQVASGAPVGCTGTWTASVVDLATGNVLATAKYNLDVK